MNNPNSHYFQVEIEVSEFRSKIRNPEKLNFVMPVWTPGSYLVREFSRNVLEFKALNLQSQEEELPSSKTSKNVWSVETRGADGVKVQYSVYAFEFTVDTSYLDNFHGIINGASVFMYVDGLEGESATLDVVMNPRWQKVCTGLKKIDRTQDGTHSYEVPNFDILVDSPIEIGNQVVREFESHNIRHEVSIFTQGHIDQNLFVSDLERIVDATIGIFENIPYDRYVFLVDFVADGGGGGLEHLNSTQCIAQLFRMQPVMEYHDLLSLFSHEFFHAWNVKRMRPKGLGPFDYTKETYTKSLWVSEGITSYYDDLILRRARIFSVPEYLDAFSQNVNMMTALPGPLWQSAEEASFDTWIKHYRQNENSPNVLASYYLQGAVIGWMLDLEIQRSTNLAKNLDDAMKRVYDQSFVEENRGFTDKEFEQACLETAPNSSVAEIFRDRVRGRKKVDFGNYLGFAGLKSIPKKEPKGEGFLGIRAREDSAKVVISNVLSDTAAEAAGLSPSDEIVAIDGLRVDKAKLQFCIANRRMGDEVALVAARMGSTFETKAKLAEKPVFEYRIAKKDSATEQEKALFKNWLGAAWDDEIKYQDYTPSPSRRNVLDYF